MTPLAQVKRLIPIALLLASLGVVAVFYLAGHPFRAYLLENSDLLYLPALFSDVGAHGGKLSDWFLTPAPYFFPDFLTYFVAYVLGSDTVSRVGLFAVVQTLVAFGALWLLASRVSRSTALIQAVTITIGLVWLALNADEPFVILLASASHYGAFISAILCAALWLHYRTTPHQARRTLALCALCMLAFLSALSDAFFLVQVIVPFTAATVLVALPDQAVSMRRSRAGILGALALIALAVPALIYRMPIPPPAINVAWSPAVSDEQRATLETRFHLTDADFRGDHLWTYRMADTTSANVGALVRDPAVEDTQHIDRQTYAVDGATSPLQRAEATLPIGLCVSTFVVLGLGFLWRAWDKLRGGRSLTDEGVILLPAIFGALGSLSYTLVVAHPTRYPPSIGLEKAYDNISDLYVGVSRAVAATPALGVVGIGYLGLVALALYAGRARAAGRDYPRQLSWVAAFSLLAICATFLVACLITDFPAMPRYLIPAYSWPVAGVVLLLCPILGHRTFAFSASASALIVATLGMSAYALVQSNGLRDRSYAAEISCIDNALEPEGLTHGIAQYWDAKYVQQLSRLDLTIAQYLENLEAMKWIISDRYYRERYDFAIISENAEPTYTISADLLARINGAPKQVVSCGTRSVYIYGKDKLRTTPVGEQ